MSDPQRICVYCSSSDGVDPAYYDQARRLGEAIGAAGHALVWGGGRVGLMGEVARACRDAGGTTYGVIPDSMTDVEVADYDSTDLVVTETMRERKRLMDEAADAFVVLPGGFGTLEELAEVLVLRLLRYHDRPVVIVNVDGFYDPLLTLFDHFIEHRVAKPEHLELFAVVSDADAVLNAITGG